MSLAAEGRLGIYEAITPLGAGEMGEVYRATDTRLHRDRQDGRPKVPRVLQRSASTLGPVDGSDQLAGEEMSQSTSRS
jgi:hypothetical protein